MIYAIIAMFFVIPIIAVIWWISNVVKFRQAKRNNKLNPDTHSKDEIKDIKSNLIISSIIAFVLMAIVVGLVVLYAGIIMYM